MARWAAARPACKLAAKYAKLRHRPRHGEPNRFAASPAARHFLAVAEGGRERKPPGAANPGVNTVTVIAPCLSVPLCVAALSLDPEQSAMKMFLKALVQSMQKDYHDHRASVRQASAKRTLRKILHFDVSEGEACLRTRWQRELSIESSPTLLRTPIIIGFNRSLISLSNHRGS